MLSVFGAFAQSHAHQAALVQQAAYQQQLAFRSQITKTGDQLYAAAEAHAREQRDLRNSIRGRTWKCGPWTWET
jgi:hypothetical protein